jgi:hypothetical protein
MVEINDLFKEASTILVKANEIGIKQIFIAENAGNNLEEEEEYLSPYSFIFSKKDDSFSNTELVEFQNYLQSKFKDVGIRVFSIEILKFNIEQENSLSQISKHLLDSAIDITQIKTDKSWKQQFVEQRSKKKGNEVGLETELLEQTRGTLSMPKATSTLSNQPSGTEDNQENQRLEQEAKRQKLDDTLSSPLFQFVLGILDEKQKGQIGQQYPEIADKLSSPRTANQSSSPSEGTPNSSPQKPVIPGTGLEVS